MWTRESKAGLVWTIALAGLMLVGTGCQSGPYLSGYSYQPQPGVYDVRKHGAEQQASPLTAMVSVLGVRRADPDHNVPASVDLRLRFESNGTEPISFDPSTLELVTGSLRPFLRPSVSPPMPLQLSSGQQQTVTATFPFPPNSKPEQWDLNELRLRWVVQVAGFAVPQTALFERTGTGDDNGNYAPTQTPTSSDLAY
jgi:hypothetical protein